MKKLLMGTLGMAMAVSAMGAVTGAPTDPAAAKITGTLTLAQMPSSQTYSIKVTKGGDSLAFGDLGEVVLNGKDLTENQKKFNDAIGGRSFIVVDQNDNQVKTGIQVATSGPKQTAVSGVGADRWFNLTENGEKSATNVFFKSGEQTSTTKMGFVTTVADGEVTLTSKLYENLATRDFGAYTINGQVWIKKVM